MNSKEEYKCSKCGHIYELPELNRGGFTFWNCPSCGVEDGVHTSLDYEDIFSEEELKEIDRKKNTFCSLKILFTSIKDIPKFKKYDPSLVQLGNKKLLECLSSNGGIVKKNISLLDAEHIKRKAESCGLEVAINA